VIDGGLREGGRVILGEQEIFLLPRICAAPCSGTKPQGE